MRQTSEPESLGPHSWPEEQVLSDDKDPSAMCDMPVDSAKEDLADADGFI